MTWTRRVVVFLCLAPALALTVLRLAQPDIGVAVRLVSFTPLALVLYFVVLLLTLGKLVFPGRGGWQVHAVIAVVAVGGLVLHGWWLGPQFVGTAPPAANGAQPIRVLTVNLLHGEADGPTVVERAVLDRVDVLVLEEVTPGALDELRRAGIEQAFPHQAGAARESVSGTMVFAVGEISEARRLSTRFDSWAMSIALPQGDERVFAVHPQPPMGSATGWREDLATIAAAVRDQHPDLVAGDFNATADHAPFEDLLDAGLDDAAERANTGWQPTWPANGNVGIFGLPVPRLVQIDHVLVGPRITALHVETVAVDDTDHAGVLAEVVMR
jgi:endonuclease/exonuclease/phosphatase family metal-dependent hydrolase